MIDPAGLDTAPQSQNDILDYLFGQAPIAEDSNGESEHIATVSQIEITIGLSLTQNSQADLLLIVDGFISESVIQVNLF